MQRGGCHTWERQAGGFTLLEMVFVLAIIVVLTTWMTLSVTTVETEQKLRKAAGVIESLAKRARSIAITQQRPYELLISAEGISISPRYGLDPDEADHARGAFDDPGSGQQGFRDITANEATDREVIYEIKRWRSDQWELLEGEKKIRITLDPMGLVEPISIRCSLGKSWLIQDLHPLTAGVRDEQMSIEKE